MKTGKLSLYSHKRRLWSHLSSPPRHSPDRPVRSNSVQHGRRHRSTQYALGCCNVVRKSHYDHILHAGSALGCTSQYNAGYNYGILSIVMSSIMRGNTIGNARSSVWIPLGPQANQDTGIHTKEIRLHSTRRQVTRIKRLADYSSYARGIIYAGLGTGS